MDDCVIRAFDGCRCEDGHCKSAATDLGRFQKSNDLTGVFLPDWRIFLAIVAFAAGLLGTVLTVHELQQQEQQYQASRT